MGGAITADTTHRPFIKTTLPFRSVNGFLGRKFEFSSNPPRLTGGYYLHRGENKLQKTVDVPLETENKVLYDALSITSKIHSPHDLLEVMGMTAVSFQNVRGAHGYQDRLYWESISIHYNGKADMGIWLELTGQGCRAFETYGNGDYESLFDLVLFNDGEMKITRLDVAFDDHTGILDLDVLCHDTRSGQFISKFNDWQVIESNKGCTINHGSMKSELFIRIYDKAMERGFTDGRHWVRVELQLRRDRAKAFVLQGLDIGKTFAGVLANYIRYIDASPDSNKWRWDMKPYWENLLDGAMAIKIFEKPGTEYNMENLENFVYRQAGNAITALLQVTTLDNFKERLKERGTVQNPKYLKLIEQYGRVQHAIT